MSRNFTIILQLTSLQLTFYILQLTNLTTLEVSRLSLYPSHSRWMNNNEHQREANTVMFLWIFIYILKGTPCFLGFNFHAKNFLTSNIYTEIFAKTVYTMIASSSTRMLEFKWRIHTQIKNLNQRIIQLREEGKPCDLCVKLNQIEFLFWKPAVSCLWMGLILSFTRCKLFQMTKRLAKNMFLNNFEVEKEANTFLKVFTLKYSPGWAVR